MVRMNEVVLAECQKRDCAPLETFLLGLRLGMWPIFQKEMNAQVESLKKMVDGAGSGYLMRGTTLKDSWIQLVGLSLVDTPLQRLTCFQTRSVKDMPHCLHRSSH